MTGRTTCSKELADFLKESGYIELLIHSHGDMSTEGVLSLPWPNSIRTVTGRDSAGR